MITFSVFGFRLREVAICQIYDFIHNDDVFYLSLTPPGEEGVLITGGPFLSPLPPMGERVRVRGNEIAVSLV
jgi:hypothetical protein